MRRKRRTSRVALWAGAAALLVAATAVAVVRSPKFLDADWYQDDEDDVDEEPRPGDDEQRA